MREKDQNWPR